MNDAHVYGYDEPMCDTCYHAYSDIPCMTVTCKFHGMHAGSHAAWQRGDPHDCMVALHALMPCSLHDAMMMTCMHHVDQADNFALSCGDAEHMCVMLWLHPPVAGACRRRH